MRGVLEDFQEDITETLETHSASKRFSVRYDNERYIFNMTWAQAFHHAVIHLLFTGI